MPPPWKSFAPQSTTSTPSVATSVLEVREEEKPGQTTSVPWTKSLHNVAGNSENSNLNWKSSSFSSNSAKSNEVKVSFWSAGATEDDLSNIFSSVGEITKAKVLPAREGRDITLCFVTFGSDSEAENAVQQLNNYEFDGRRLRVQINDNATRKGSVPPRSSGFSNQDSDNQRFGGQGFGSSPPSANGNKVKVMSCPSTLSENALRTLFSEAGEIQNIRLLPPRDGRDITLAFVTFVSNASAEAAVKRFNRYEIEGKCLRVEIDDYNGRKGNTSSSSEAKGNKVKILSCPASVSEDELKQLFSGAGDVENVRLLPPRDDRDTTLAFITFSKDTDAARAVQQFNNYELEGKCLRVSIDDKGKQQNGSKPSGWGSTGPTNEGGKNGWGASTSCGGAVNPWGPSAATPDEGAKTLAAPKTDTSSVEKPWGSFTSNSNDGASGFKQSLGNQVNENQSRFNDGDDGILTNANVSRPGPIIYVPPPPPEEEVDIFNDACHQGINFEKYENIPVEVTGNQIPDKVKSFQEADLHEMCLKNIVKAEYNVPTPIQKHALPIALAKRDVMACAQTGSGKTAAYLLPVISDLLKSGRAGAQPCETAVPNALIIVPTRELASQIFLEARKFSFGTSLRTVVIYGGVSVSHQLGMVQDGCNVLVATPGRLLDFIERGRVSMSNVQYLILDEADRMLDMGFGPTMENILKSHDMVSKEQRQTLMFSATFPESIQTLAGNYLNDYIFITVGRVGGASSDIVQTVLELPGAEKRTKLEELLIQSGSDRTLVFVETKRSADFLASFLSQRNFPTTSISSDRSQQERELALKDFRTGKAPVLIATAVAARGLDIPDVKHVINFDLPCEIDEYVHRIGRTGRIGNQGQATAFFDKSRDTKISRGLCKVLAESAQIVPEWLEEVAMSAVGTGYGPSGGNFSSRDKRQNYGQRFAKGPTPNDTPSNVQQELPPVTANGDSSMWF
eukprot:gene7667-8503_t